MSQPVSEMAGQMAAKVDTARRVFRELGEIDWLEAIFAVTLATGLIFGTRVLVERVAGLLPERFRFWVLPWAPILRLVILLAALAWVVPIFIRPTPENLLAIGGAVAVALGFAFKDYVSSLLAGVVVLYERPYRTGDWVHIGDAYGEVRGLGLRTVDLVTPDDTRVSIPHNAIWTEAIHNENSGQRELQVVADFYLDPEHDGRIVREVLMDVALTSPWVHLERDIAVVAAEKPWYTHFRLKAYPIDGRDQFRFRTDLTVRGKAALARAGMRPARPSAMVGGGS